jgi:hypothetical protein
MLVETMRIFVHTAAQKLQFPLETLKLSPHFGFIVTKRLIFFITVGTETGKILAGGDILALQVGIFRLQTDGSPIKGYDILSCGTTGHQHDPDRKAQQRFIHNISPVSSGCCQGKKNCPPTSSGQVNGSAGTLIGRFFGHR